MLKRIGLTASAIAVVVMTLGCVRGLVSPNWLKLSRITSSAPSHASRPFANCL